MNQTADLHSAQPLLRQSPVREDQLILDISDEIRSIFEMTLSEIRRMVKAKTADFYLFSEEGELFSFMADSDSDEGKKISVHCIQNKATLSFKGGEFLELKEWGPDRISITAEISAPAICAYLGVTEGSIGAIVIQNPVYFDQFFDSDLRFVSSLASAYSNLLKSGWRKDDGQEIFFNFKSGLNLLLENAHLNQSMNEAESQLRSVLEVSNLINSSRELNEMIEKVLYSARKVTRAESASLFQIDEKTGELYFEIISGDKESGLTGIRIPPGKGIVGKAADTGQPILVNDVSKDPQFYADVDKISQWVTRNLLAAPLLINGEAIGVIEVLNTIDRPHFTDHDLEIFQSFSDSVAIAIQRRRLLDDLQKTNTALQKRLKEVSILHSVAARLVESRTVQELFDEVLRIIVENLDVGRASIMMREGKDLRTVSKAGNYSAEPDYPTPRHTSLSVQVLESNRPLFVNNLGDDDILFSFASPERYKTGATIIIPFSSARYPEPFGVICVSEPLTGKFFEEDFRLLSTIATQLVRGYENFRLTEESLANRALEKEMEITSRIQKNILPSREPEHLYMTLSARSEMARTIGGDFFDYYVPEMDGDAIMLVADVSGKSLPAALFMALSSSIIRTIIRQEKNPAQILSLANDLLYEESHSGMFVTVFMATYQPEQGKIQFASAGHNEMLLMHPDGSYEILSGKGAPLGVIQSSRQKFLGGEVAVSDGDLLVLYTDGIVEAVNGANEEFGLENFIKILQKNFHKTPKEIIDITYNTIVTYSGSNLQYDDFTMLLSRFHGIVKGKQMYHIALPAKKDSVPVLRDFVCDLLLKHGVIGQKMDDILLSCDEASTNIVLHAYNGIPDPNPRFECDVEIESRKLFRILFIDKGVPFSLEEVKEPDLQENLSGKRKGGFGVYLIRALMDKVQYRREEGQNYFLVEKILEKKE